MGLYERLGVRTLINARGNATLAGGTLMDTEVMDAMAEASRSFVRIGDLQEAASGRIAALTGAEAGYVTSGAAAALTLGTAAVITRLRPDLMDRLPDTGDAPSEVIVQASHRNGYDHLVRAAGARLVEIGDRDGAGATVDQMASAIGPATAGAFYQGLEEERGLPVEAFIAVAHAHDLPVLVDASMNLPPRANLRRFIELGADLVAFSGGKSIRGPQASGFLAGRAELLLAVGLQQQDMDELPSTWVRRHLLESGTLSRLPDHGIGRSMKTGKEEIAGLLVALERYAARDEDAEYARHAQIADRLAAGLADVPGLTVERDPAQAGGRPIPMTTVIVDPTGYEMTAVELVRRLGARDPIILVADHDAEAGVLRLDPENLDDDGADQVIAAIRSGGR